MDDQPQKEQTQPEVTSLSPSLPAGQAGLQGTSKKERRQMRREEKRREQEKAKKVKGRKNILLWAGIAALIAAAGFGVFRYLSTAPKDGSLASAILQTCVNHTGVSMHIHPNLRIFINGEAQEIPANVGISGNCMRPIHTHDGTGKLHIEFPRTHDFTVGDFFHVWDKQFSGVMTMTVNREPNTEYEKYILKDRDEIEIRYTVK